MSDATKSSDPKVAVIVETLLAAAGLAPSADELAVLVSQYPTHQESIELLHSTPELRYESPGLVFVATPVFADWGAPA